MKKNEITTGNGYITIKERVRQNGSGLPIDRTADYTGTVVCKADNGILFVATNPMITRVWFYGQIIGWKSMEDM